MIEESKESQKGRMGAIIKQKNTDRSSKCGRITQWEGVSPLELYTFIKAEEYAGQRKPGQDEQCCICQDSLYTDMDSYEKVLQKEIQVCEQQIEIDVMNFSECSEHFFHKDCAEMMAAQYKHDFVECPVCMHVYGIKRGTQPNGTMSVNVDPNTRCTGYSCGTIIINYHFPSGRKEDGTRYSGTSRTAYLPNNKEGKEVLELLRVGFERRVIFTVGTSVTTGQTNTVVWGGIHHKTNLSGGSSHFGYPDPTYFERVKLELATKGVTLQNMHLK